MPDNERLPIMFAPDASGVLRHVDEVPNGLACGCICPNPSCAQELVAKNTGTKRIHHFAHNRSTCEWFAESAMVHLALEAVTSANRIALPKLAYRDETENQDVEISPARTLRVSAASLEQISGRDAPELVVTCTAGSQEKRFAVVVSLIHSLKDSELEKLSLAGIDVVLIDLRESLNTRKHDEGKHFDRTAIIAGYQNRSFVEGLLLDETCPYKSWVLNSKRALAEAESARLKRDRVAEQEFPTEVAAQKQNQSAVEAIEISACELHGNQARLRTKRGNREYASGCPLYGETDIVGQCGAYSYSPTKCPHFVAIMNYVIECSLKR